MKKLFLFCAIIAVGCAGAAPKKSTWPLELGCIQTTVCGMSCGQELFTATRWTRSNTAQGFDEGAHYVCWETR
jgi:hypothetical protein